VSSFEVVSASELFANALVGLGDALFHLFAVVCQGVGDGATSGREDGGGE
jgi:hypothetical protein